MWRPRAGRCGHCGPASRGALTLADPEASPASCATARSDAMPSDHSIDGQPMRTLGVDGAGATKKAAVAVIEWSGDRARLAHLALDVDDQEIVDLFGTCGMTGVDCPVGWPDALIPFLTGHLNFNAAPVLEHDGLAGRRLLAYRDTDRFVTRETGL